MPVTIADRTVPEAPSITSASGTDGKAQFGFVPALPAEKTSQFLALRSGSDRDIGVVIGDPLPATARQFTDLYTSPGESYWYRLVAVDKNGNVVTPRPRSPSASVPRRCPLRPLPPRSTLPLPTRTSRCNSNRRPQVSASSRRAAGSGHRRMDTHRRPDVSADRHRLRRAGIGKPELPRLLRSCRRQNRPCQRNRTSLHSIAHGRHPPHWRGDYIGTWHARRQRPHISFTRLGKRIGLQKIRTPL